MRIAKRVFLFLAVNVLVVATISIVLNLLGVRPYLNARGIDMTALAVFCLVWGFGGAFISLGLSRVMAKWGMGVKVIDPPITYTAVTAPMHPADQTRPRTQLLGPSPMSVSVTPAR